MLDRYWWGDVTRISPEAPVPIVRLQRDTFVPGGAANVAMNAAGLGAETILFGLVGDDPESRILGERLTAAGISAQHLIVSQERPTNVKTRIIAHNQQVVRVDREVTSSLSSEECCKLIEKLKDAMGSVDVVLVSDYAKGILSTDVLESVFTLAKALRKTVVVDPKGKDYSKYVGATVLTPNRREAAEACNMEIDTPDLTNQAGGRLLSELDLDAILITESEHGMTLFERDTSSAHFDAASKEVYDVTGAGDTVIATLGVALAAGSELFEAARLANLAAGVVVQQVGTAPIKKNDLAAIIGQSSAA
jgi:D-beta-D-heptose 7-phosphate kinase/D-beta-D-heptose 1-phosphate adenosyltransferase